MRTMLEANPERNLIETDVALDKVAVGSPSTPTRSVGVDCGSLLVVLARPLPLHSHSRPRLSFRSLSFSRTHSLFCPSLTVALSPRLPFLPPTPPYFLSLSRIDCVREWWTCRS